MKSAFENEENIVAGKYRGGEKEIKLITSSSFFSQNDF